MPNSAKISQSIPSTGYKLFQEFWRHWSQVGYSDCGIIREVDHATQLAGFDLMFDGIGITTPISTKAPNQFISHAYVALRLEMLRAERIGGLDKCLVGDRDSVR